MIVNSCAPNEPENIAHTKEGKDRRIITYHVTPTGFEMLDKGKEMGLETRNEFIRLKKLNGDNLQLCTDKSKNFVANIGTKYAYGIGIDTESRVEDLGLDELNVLVIHKMLCLGHKAIGLIVTDNQDRLTVITYFLGKMKDTDNRVHSYFHLTNGQKKLTFKNAQASEGDGLVFYNIEVHEDDKDHIMAVDLHGPDVFIKSTLREVAYETEIEVQNKRENQKFDILVEFEKLTQKGGMSHRKIGTEIKKKVYSNVEKFTHWHGPVWSMTYHGSAGKILELRLSDKKVWIESNTADLKILSVSAIQYCNKKLFMLTQTDKESVILVMNEEHKEGESPTVISLHKVCQSLRVTPNFMNKVSNGFMFLTNCFIESGTAKVIKDGPHPRMTYFTLTDNDLKNTKIDLKTQAYNTLKDFPSVQYDLIYLHDQEEKKKRILNVQEQGILKAGEHQLTTSGKKEIMICFIHKHNRTMFMSNLMHNVQTAD